MHLERSYGILLHPTSLPGPYGIGVLGEDARVFSDWLHQAGARWWQALPLGPTGFGDSPYSSGCSFAGNPFLVDPLDLQARGWLKQIEPIAPDPTRVDFALQWRWKWRLLREALQGFRARAEASDRSDLASFQESSRYWLEEYALYRTLRAAQENRPWDAWPAPLKHREPQALRQAREVYADEVELQIFAQWLFSRQWAELRAYARAQGVRIIGDIPIFVSHDSPEVWAHPELFLLDEQGRPTHVAGVPPDYFSETGQLWGNPLYRWEAHQAEGFAWWIERLRTVLQTADLVRIDHFRAFQAHWEVPASARTAIEGRWVEAPGRQLFAAIRARLGDVPVIAEDLGVITPEVEALRDELGLSGMLVLQFAFDGNPENSFLPARHPAHGRRIVYTGTHDNDTTLGWWRNQDERAKADVHKALADIGFKAEREEDIPAGLIRLAFASPAKLAIVPLQDVFGLGSEARMNTPSVPEGNWSWRFLRTDLTPARAADLQAAAAASGRHPARAFGPAL